MNSEACEASSKALCSFIDFNFRSFNARKGDDVATRLSVNGSKYELADDLVDDGEDDNDGGFDAELDTHDK